MSEGRASPCRATIWIASCDLRLFKTRSREKSLKSWSRRIPLCGVTRQPGQPTDRCSEAAKGSVAAELQTLPRPLSADDGYFNYYRGVPLAIWLQKWSWKSSGHSINSVNQTVSISLSLWFFQINLDERSSYEHETACWETTYEWVMGSQRMHKNTRQDIFKECELERRSASGKIAEIKTGLHFTSQNIQYTIIQRFFF